MKNVKNTVKLYTAHDYETQNTSSVLTVTDVHHHLDIKSNRLRQTDRQTNDSCTHTKLIKSVTITFAACVLFCVLLFHSCIFMSCNFMSCIFMSCIFTSVIFMSCSFSCPAISCPANWSFNFMSCNFMPCTLVRQFHVLQFHALQIGPSFSRPSFSRPAFSAPPFKFCTHIHRIDDRNKSPSKISALEAVGVLSRDSRKFSGHTYNYGASRGRLYDSSAFLLTKLSFFLSSSDFQVLTQRFVDGRPTYVMINSFEVWTSVIIRSWSRCNFAIVKPRLLFNTIGLDKKITLTKSGQTLIHYCCSENHQCNTNLYIDNKLLFWETLQIAKLVEFFNWQYRHTAHHGMSSVKRTSVRISPIDELRMLNHIHNAQH